MRKKQVRERKSWTGHIMYTLKIHKYIKQTVGNYKYPDESRIIIGVFIIKILFSATEVVYDRIQK